MNLFERLFDKRSSAQTAKQRLQLVLVHDRTEIPPGMIALIKDDIVAVISRRVNIDRERVVVSITHEDKTSKLLVDIPLLSGTDGQAASRAWSGTKGPDQRTNSASH
ncbi:MAG: cell division topological specificity factor MinE [Thermoflexales bacterium]